MRLTTGISILALVILLPLAVSLAEEALPPRMAPPEPDKTQVDVAKPTEAGEVPREFTLRARLASMKPEEPTEIAWRWGGEGLGGAVTRGKLAEKIGVGEWTEPVAVATMAKGRPPGKWFLTFTCGRGGQVDRQTHEKSGYSTDVVMELEFSFRGKPVKTLKEVGPDGGSIGIVIPAYLLGPDKTPGDPKFLADLVGLLEYAKRRAEMLEKLSWASRPVPRRFAIQTDLGGYDKGVYYGIRTTDRAVIEAECSSLRQLGINGLRNAPGFVWQMAERHEGIGKDLGRMRDVAAMGYPVPTARKGDAKPDPEAGCPFAAGVPQRTEEGVKKTLDEMLALRTEEVWGLTVDEIGSVLDRAPEGKSHFARCPRCTEAFGAWLREKGLKPADFGKGDWADVKPLDMAPPKGEEPDLANPGTALAAYYTRVFNNVASARLFTPLRDACARANDAKRKALAEGRKDAREAGQPWVYTYALRGNTFLMKGHSLDFFDFYRYADNAFCYETSNRDPRVWQWDSYLCDVGRGVSAKQNLAMGIYVKPHRGAPIQRALAAAARGATMIYWYTYGPDWSKGDSFSDHPDALALVSKGARILARAEDVLYGAAWARPAEVAVVKPQTSEIWLGLRGTPDEAASWENAKWVYTALSHAHVPVDAIDEGILAAEDLARYKVIYINGTHLRRDAAEKVAAWVRAGGTLWTSGRGLAADEADRPAAALLPVLGLESRTPPEMYCRVTLYGATELESFSDPKAVIQAAPQGAKIVVEGEFKAAFKPVVGREVLQAAAGTEVLAKFADGGAAITRSRCGKGQAYVVGFYPGLEYSAALRGESYDMAKDFDAARRAIIAAPALGAVKLPLEVSHPTVEAVLVKGGGGRTAIVLVNWAYRATSHEDAAGKVVRTVALVPARDVRVTITGPCEAKGATSAAADKPVLVERVDGRVVVTVPELAEGDVVLLE